ncbi:MAG: hypothetical protein GX820_02830, partial [Bacteroidales bacterium]|nr:hypothetical protein [Bacteroidales bacterium]
NDDVILKYRIAGLLLEYKQEKEALKMLSAAMNQDFSQIEYFFDLSPKALKNRKIKKLINDFRANSTL